MNELEIINHLKKIVKNPSALKLSDDVFFDKKMDCWDLLILTMKKSII